MRDFNKLVDHVKWMEGIVRGNTVKGATIRNMLQGCSKGDGNQSAAREMGTNLPLGNINGSLGSESEDLTEGRS